MFPLTIDNLKQATPGNDKFHALLEENFGAGQKLGEFDTFHKMFKVDRLWDNSRS